MAGRGGRVVDLSITDPILWDDYLLSVHTTGTVGCQYCATALHRRTPRERCTSCTLQVHYISISFLQSLVNNAVSICIFDVDAQADKRPSRREQHRHSMDPRQDQSSPQVSGWCVHVFWCSVVISIYIPSYHYSWPIYHVFDVYSTVFL